MSDIKISLNNQEISLTAPTTLADFLATQHLQAPFAVAVNTAFVAKQHYAQTVLHDGDKIDIVRPVVGG